MILINKVECSAFSYKIWLFEIYSLAILFVYVTSHLTKYEHIKF